MTIIHIWDGNNIIAEANEETDLTALYVRGIGLLAVETADEYGNASRKAYLNNAHGDVVQLADENGDVLWYYDYDAFGNEVNPQDGDENPFRYCGEYSDDETETIYLRARNYSPATGRFTQQDDWGYANTTDPLSLNLYTYCANNPVGFVDPSGHEYRWEREERSPFSKLGRAFAVGLGNALIDVAYGIGGGIAHYTDLVAEKFKFKNGNYIVLICSIAEAFALFGAMQLITDDVLESEIALDRNGNVFKDTHDCIHVIVTIKTRVKGSKPKGTELIRKLIESGAGLMIVVVKTKPSAFSPYGLTYSDVDYDDPAIQMNLSQKPWGGYDYGSTKNIAIILAHEMIHALHFIENSETYIKGNRNVAYREKGEPVTWEEMFTVGLGSNSATPYNTKITENDIRGEQKISKRKKYYE